MVRFVPQQHPTAEIFSAAALTIRMLLLPVTGKSHKQTINKTITVVVTNKRRSRQERLLIVLAEWTGLEPATPGVTGRYSNQLNYHSLA
jgi:hypothetical protein